MNEWRHTIRRRRKLLTVGGILGICVCIVLALRWLGVPSVQVVNDLDVNVGLRNCVDWRAMDARESRSVSPSRPCFVWEVQGSQERYLGCLEFPDEAFTGRMPVLMSSLNKDMSRDDCLGLDRYTEHSRLWRFFRRL